MSKNYKEQVNENTKKYYSILSKDFPNFLNDYIYSKIFIANATTFF